MNTPRILVAQHQAIEALFRELSAETHPSSRALLGERLAEEVIAYMAGEEAVIYPAARQALKRAGEGGDGREVGEGIARGPRDPRHMLRLQLRRFLETPEHDEAFPARLATLREVFDEHVRAQERELFPRLAEAMGEAHLEALGAEAAAARPPVWIVMTEWQARRGAAGARAARSGVSLPSTR